MTHEAVDGVTLLDAAYVDLIDAMPFANLDADALVALRDGMRSVARSFRPSGDLSTHDARTRSRDGYEVTLRVHRPVGLDGPRPCIYAIHGGGFVFGSYEMLDASFERWCTQLGVVGVAVEYRLAPEHPYPAPLDDCDAGLRWIFEHHQELGIDPARIGVHGTSAGGGLAVALALRTHDRAAVPLSFLVLECPMLDDRFVTASSNLDRLQIWSREANQFGWRSYLGEWFGREDVPPYAAPARAGDLARLPPAIVCVGGADGFRDEDVDFAMRLCAAGVPTELHVYPGTPHGGVQLLPHAPASRQWTRDVEDWLGRQIAGSTVGRRA